MLWGRAWPPAILDEIRLRPRYALINCAHSTCLVYLSVVGRSVARSLALLEGLPIREGRRDRRDGSYTNQRIPTPTPGVVIGAFLIAARPTDRPTEQRRPTQRPSLLAPKNATAPARPRGPSALFGWKDGKEGRRVRAEGGGEGPHISFLNAKNVTAIERAGRSSTDRDSLRDRPTATGRLTG